MGSRTPQLVRPASAWAGTGSRSRSSFALVAVSLVVFIAGCRTAPPPPPPPADTVTATSSPDDVLDSFTLAPGEWKDYELSIPAGIRQNHDVVYLELGDAGAAAVLELRSPVYWSVMASSAAASRFVRGAISGVPQPVPLPAGTGAGRGLTPSAVTENRACLGPCIIFRATGGTYYARVVNDGGGSVSVDLYLYGYDLLDDSEPQNDQRSNAPVLGVEESGAIELLGDVDYWLSPDDLSVTVAAVAGVEPEVVVTSSSGLVVAGPYQDGETFSVFDGESLRVRASGNASAGAPAASTYFLSSEPLPPGTPGRPPTYLEVTAGSNASQPVDTRLFTSGETVEYLLSVPSSVRGREVMYVELAQDVGLELRNGSGTSIVASSTSSESFWGGVPFGTAAGANGRLGPAAVDVNVACRGSCVIVEPDASSYRVAITNFGGSKSISLYAYGADLMDETETQNDNPGSAPVLIDNDGGAIETVQDTDYWNLAYDGTVAFDVVVGGIDLEAEIVDGNGNPVAASGGPYFSGDSLVVFEGEYIRVWAVNPSQAAASANSSYFLDYTVVNSAAASQPSARRGR